MSDRPYLDPDADPDAAPTAVRSCGACTICCKLVAVPETGKPNGAWCPACIPGTGCGIHAIRPQSCRNFECFWLMETAFPDDLRPDRCGVVVAFNDDPDSVVLHVDPDRPEAWRTEPGSHLVPALLRVYERLFIVCGDDRTMVTRAS
ncbi:hypothetical protein [Arenibaculum pallidiluteum]|uniref:hypothetical protein n=1 Tax=Arenibaculum pallidiluteum TaxID=2812559 RepID=UPI001A9569F6|nr:hypothetical protein [Arenibaculum pallidiluteum]